MGTAAAFEQKIESRGFFLQTNWRQPKRLLLDVLCLTFKIVIALLNPCKVDWTLEVFLGISSEARYQRHTWTLSS